MKRMAWGNSGHSFSHKKHLNNSMLKYKPNRKGCNISMIIEDKLSMIEDVFYRRLSKKIDDKAFCKELSTVLSSIHNYKYDICISNYNGKETFYGMRIFPAMSKTTGEGSYDDILNPMLMPDNARVFKLSFSDCYDRWKRLDHWILEIDATVFDSTQINLNPRELVAMMLHEIGHVIYSEKTLERIYLAMMDMKMAQSAMIRYRMSLTTYLFYPVILAGCKLRTWMVGKNELNIEVFADKNVTEYGYGEDLISAFGKVVKYFGRSVEPTSPETEARFSADLVTQLSARQSRVGHELYIKAMKSPSRFIQGIYRTMISKLGLASRNRYTGEIIELPASEALFAPDFIMKNELIMPLKASIACENLCRSADNRCRIATEAFTLKHKNSSRMNDAALDEIQYDIDKISIDADKICSHHDRVYVLDLIYNVNDDLNEWRTALDEGTVNKRYTERVKTLFDRLSQLRHLVLSKKNFDKRYEVFVKYPEGYEG